ESGRWSAWHTLIAPFGPGSKRVVAKGPFRRHPERSAAGCRPLLRGHHHERGRDLLAILLFVAGFHAGARLQRPLLHAQGGRERELGAVIERHHTAARIDALDLALNLGGPGDRR